MVVAMGTTDCQNGNSNDSRGSLNAVSGSRCAPVPNCSSTIRAARLAQVVEFGGGFPSGVERRWCVPRPAEPGEQLFVELEHRLNLVVARGIVGTGAHQPARIAE